VDVKLVLFTLRRLKVKLSGFSGNFVEICE